MFRLAWDPGAAGGADLRLDVGDSRLESNSYYFAINRDDRGDESSGDRTRRVLGTMLEQWRTAVEKCPAGGVAFLPFDLQDEHTGWVRCSVGESCTLEFGTAPVEGYKIWPNDWQKWKGSVPAFQVRSDVPPLRMSREDVLAAIDASRLELAEPPPLSDRL
ncbi:MAG: hypothetical protein KF774_04755 [Planctomyces sp.]|nr:hypothetical protein [Planctomyces sp.]